MLKRVGEPGAEIPECMRDPVVVVEAGADTLGGGAH